MYNKTYTYKIYNSTGGFLDTLADEVITEPSWTQEINSSGSVFDIDIARTTNYGSGTDLAVGNIIDIYVYYGEYANWVTHVPDNVVNEDGDQFIFASGSPNGRRVFSGIITRVIPKFGADYITISIASRGLELQNTVVEEYSKDFNSTDLPSDGPGGKWGNTSTGANQFIAQVITPTITDYLVSVQNPVYAYEAITDSPVTTILAVYEGSNPATDLPATNISTGNGQANFMGSSEVTWAEGLVYLSYTSSIGWQFNSGIRLIAGTSYIFVFIPALPYIVLPASDGPFGFVSSLTILQEGNTLWRKVVGTGWVQNLTEQLFLTVELSGGDTTVPYNSQDPSQTVKDIMDINVFKDGVVTYNDSTIDYTGIVSSYTFNLATIQEGVDKMLEFAPTDWYWYVHLGANLLYFKPQHTTPDIYITKGKEIQSLELIETVENIRNTVYFSGGDIGGGVNLFIKRENTTSVDTWGRRIERVSDNRVTDTTTAQIIADGILDRYANPSYQTALELNANKTDIENIRIGQTIGFRNFDNFIDSLMLQIVSLQYNPHSVTISLDSLLPRVSRNIENIKRNLNLLETADNPVAPS